MPLEVGSVNRRTLLFGVGGIALILILRFGVYGGGPQTAVAATDSIPMAEKRLARVRQVEATVSGKEELVTHAKAELADREQGIINADTEQQAQAQLTEITQTIAKSNGIDARGSQGLSGQPISDDYGEISYTVAFTCAIEQLVNLLTALGNQPAILATNEISVNGGSDKKKNVQVRLTVSAIVPRKLIPKTQRGVPGL
jgi:Type II secretion system (T2SS), protein M subtype b